MKKTSFIVETIFNFCEKLIFLQIYPPLSSLPGVYSSSSPLSNPAGGKVAKMKFSNARQRHLLKTTGFRKGLNLETCRNCRISGVGSERERRGLCAEKLPFEMVRCNDFFLKTTRLSEYDKGDYGWMIKW